MCSFLCDSAPGPCHRPRSRRNHSLSRQRAAFSPSQIERAGARQAWAHGGVGGGPAFTRLLSMCWSVALNGDESPGSGHSSCRSIAWENSGWIGRAGNTRFPPCANQDSVGSPRLHPRKVPAFSLELHLAPKHFLPARVKPILALPALPRVHGEPCSQRRCASDAFPAFCTRGWLFFPKFPVGP